MVVLVLVLVACGGEREPEGGVILAGTPSPVQVVLVSGDFGVGRPRVSFVLYEGTAPLRDVQGVVLTAVSLDDPEGEPVWSGTAESYTDYVIPYWVVYPELPTPGYWGMTAEITLANGEKTVSTFVVGALEETSSPAIGEMAPASHNRTIHTEPDLSKLSSGANPDPAFYQMTVAEAIASGKPTVVGILTPGLCQTSFCAPVLDSVKQVRDEVGERVNFIHIEVYADFETLAPVPEMAEWGLVTEPWVFVLDENGRVAAKFNGPVSPRELMAALQPLLAAGGEG